MRVNLPALSAGVAVGLILASLSLGVGSTHVACSRGALVGWSGVLAAPDAIGLSPPGGAVTFSWENNWGNVGGAGGGDIRGGPTSLWNSTNAYFEVDNWTLYSVVSRTLAGPGERTPCPTYDVGTGTPGNQTVPWGGCAGCPVANATPPGVGERLEIPRQINYSIPNASVWVDTTFLDAGYGPVPNATLTWHVQAGQIVDSGLSLGADRPVQLWPYYNGTRLFGLAISVTYTSMGLDIPVRLLNGTMIDIGQTYPGDMFLGGDSTSYFANFTYILPAVSDQGTWQVYTAGSGGPLSIDGLLFVQSST